MGTSAQERDFWKQIDEAEYYLVGGSFEQAVSTALSVADQIHAAAASEDACDDDVLDEMLEVAGMVLVQALKELGRVSEMFVQLKEMCGSVTSIPVKVFLTGASMQIAEGSGSDLKPIFQEYLAKWRYRNDQVYVLIGEQDSSSNISVASSVMSVEQYLEVAEMYTITLLSIFSQETEFAISWAEKAELPEQDRQVLLKRLHTLQSSINKKSSLAPGAKQAAERNHSASVNGSTQLLNEDTPNSMTPEYNGKVHRFEVNSFKSIQPSLQRVANQIDPFFWWFHSVRVNFGKFHCVLPSGKKMLIFSLLFSIFFILRKKSAGFKRVAYQQASSLRRALLQTLQLAFSVQMNPLAAVQQVPQATRGSW